MRTLRPLLALLLVILTGFSSLASAQERHIVAPAALAAAVGDHVARQAADRAVVREALARPEVQSVAASAGFDLAQIDAAVDMLSGADLARAADTARQVNGSLVGGASTIVISTTTIILILLIVLLVVLITG